MNCICTFSFARSAPSLPLFIPPPPPRSAFLSSTPPPRQEMSPLLPLLFSSLNRTIHSIGKNSSRGHSVNESRGKRTKKRFEKEKKRGTKQSERRLLRQNENLRLRRFLFLFRRAFLFIFREQFLGGPWQNCTCSLCFASHWGSLVEIGFLCLPPASVFRACCFLFCPPPFPSRFCFSYTLPGHPLFTERRNEDLQKRENNAGFKPVSFSKRKSFLRNFLYRLCLPVAFLVVVRDLLSLFFIFSLTLAHA